MDFTKGKQAARWLWPVILPFAVFVLHSLLFRTWLIDDAGISFVYARNFIHGFGLVAQPGLKPVEGFSNPLWTFLISPAFLTNPIDPTALIKTISLALVLGTYLLLTAVFQSVFRGTLWAQITAFFVLLSISINTSFVVWTTSGLENPLYAFVFALYILLLVLYGIHGDGHRLPLSVFAGLCVAGLALIRPEGIVFLAAFPAVSAIRLWNNPPEWKTEARQFGIFLAMALVPVAAYELFRIAYFGDLLPNTYYVKGGPSLRNLGDLLLLSKAYLAKTYDLFYSTSSWRAGFILLLTLAGVFHLLFKRRSVSPVIFLLPAFLGAWAAYCLLPADWFGEYRFATLFFLAFPVVFFSMAADALIASPLRSKAGYALFALVGCLFILQSAKVYLTRSLQFADAPAVPFGEIAEKYGVGFNEYAEAVNLPDASLMIADMGGTLYYSHLRVYDLGGLCDRQIGRLIRANNPVAMSVYILNLHPVFIHVHDYWSVQSGLFENDQFRQLYTPIWETPSTWAAQNGYGGIYSGDYILTSAIPSPQALSNLRQIDTPDNP